MQKIELSIQKTMETLKGMNIKTELDEIKDLEEFIEIMKGSTEFDQKMVKFLNESKDIINSLKRGDLLHIEECGNYRNDGIFIWNGQTFKPLDFDVDEYGSVPKEFLTFTEFPLGYFSVAHNTIHNFSYIKLKNHFTLLNEKTSEFGDKYFLYELNFKENSIKIGSLSKLNDSTDIYSMDKNEDFPEADYFIN